MNRPSFAAKARALGIAPKTAMARVDRGASKLDALLAPVYQRHDGSRCYGVGRRNGKCNEPTVAGGYCAACAGIMAKWGKIERAKVSK